MIGTFIIVLIFFLGFRAIGTSTDKKKPSDKMWEMMKEDGGYIFGVVLIIIIVMGLAMILL